MYRLFSIIACIFIFHLQSMSQSNILYMPFGFVNNNISGSGISNSTTYSIANAGVNNPASLYDINNTTISFAYQLETKIDNMWIAGIGLNRYKQSYPQNFSVVFPYESLRFTAGLTKVFEANIDYGDIYGTVVSPDDMMGYVVSPNPLTVERKIYINNYFAGLSYTFQSILNSNDKFSIGAQINNYKLSQYSKFDTQTYSYTAVDNSFLLGINYELLLNNDVTLKIASSYQTTSDLSDYAKGIRAELPDQFDFGAKIENYQSFDFSVGFKYTMWDKCSAIWDNTFDFSVNSIYNYSESLKFSAGFMTMFSKHQTIMYFDDINKSNYTAFYVMLGSVIKFNQFGIDFSIADSHLFSGSKAKQFIAKGAFFISL